MTPKARFSTIRPVVVRKASGILAEQLRGLILAGRFAAGDQLPTERELVADSGISRASVREALRMLEVEGLISTRPGRAGGSTVTLPGRASVARSVELFVRTHGVRLESLLDCRLGVEPFLAGLAARNHTEAAFREIQTLHERFVASVDDIPAYKRANLDWHLAVARASDNEPLIALMEAVSQPILDAAAYQQVTTNEIRAQAVRAHGRIMQAIEARDPVAASERMRRHIGAYVEVTHQAIADGTILAAVDPK